MIISIRDVIEKSFSAYAVEPRTEWVQNWPGQVVLCVSQIYWTAEVHAVLQKKSVWAVKDYHNSLTVNISIQIETFLCMFLHQYHESTQPLLLWTVSVTYLS